MLNYKLFLFSLLAGVPAFAADKLDCTLARGSKTLSVQGAIYNGLGEAQTTEPNELQLGEDASIDSGSYFIVLDDPQLHQRLAFSGSPAGAAAEPIKLELGEASLSCRKVEENPGLPLALSPRPNFIHCMLDEVPFVKDSPLEAKNRLEAIGSKPLQGPTIVQGESETASFELKFQARDFLHGLEIKITDKTTGKNSSFKGPANLMATGFMLGFTEGDRKVEAKQLRLGCFHTDDPVLQK